MQRRTLAKAKMVTLVLLIAVVALAACQRAPVVAQGTAPEQAALVELPAPITDGQMSLERAIQLRRSVRQYSPEPLTLAQIGQLAWAGQGTTDPAGHLRAAPSAGATYPMELYVFTPDGVFHYMPSEHALRKVFSDDRRLALADACLGQRSVRDAPCVVVLTAVPERTAARYGERATRYIAMEAGHIAQNILLQATALGLAGVPIGAFRDEDVARLMGIGPGEEPLYVVPVGHPR